MKPLEPPATHFVSAAIGWMELGNPAEARAELAQLAAEWQAHPDVLELRWALAVEVRDWAEALSSARLLVEQAPERSSGWLNQAYALRRVASGGLQQAWEALEPAFERFPREPIIAFNLSCYACQLNDLPLARSWLKRALALEGKERIQKLALADEDLRPLWAEIQAW